MRWLLLAALALAACKRQAPARRELPEALPARYPIPAGGEPGEAVSLGRVTSVVFTYAERDADEVAAELRRGLALIGWSARGDGRRVVTEREGATIVATASAEGGGARLTIEVHRAVADAGPPAPDAAILSGPPEGYPTPFPFLPGAALGQPAPGAVVLRYPARSPETIAAALRRRAERQGWMCTQGEDAFVCALGGRSVDVRIRARDKGSRVALRASP